MTQLFEDVFEDVYLSWQDVKSIYFFIQNFIDWQF